MFCRNCGNKMDSNAVVCVKCGVAKGSGNAYCPNCGGETNPNAAVCLKCGASLANAMMTKKGQFFNDDEGNIGWGVLSFFIPLVGLILYLTWRDSKPKTAEIAGKWALISFVIGIVFYVVYVVVITILVM